MDGEDGEDHCESNVLKMPRSTFIGASGFVQLMPL